MTWKQRWHKWFGHPCWHFRSAEVIDEEGLWTGIHVLEGFVGVTAWVSRECDCGATKREKEQVQRPWIDPDVKRIEAKIRASAT